MITNLKAFQRSTCSRNLPISSLIARSLRLDIDLEEFDAVPLMKFSDLNNIMSCVISRCSSAELVHGVIIVDLGVVPELQTFVVNANSTCL